MSVRFSGGTLWFSGVSTVLWSVPHGRGQWTKTSSVSRVSLEAAAFHQNPVKTKVTNTSFSPVRPEPCGWWPASLSRDRAPAYVNNDLEVIVP